MKHLRSCLALALAAVLAHPCPSRAAWNLNGTLIYPSTKSSYLVGMFPDLNHGAVVVCRDETYYPTDYTNVTHIDNGGGVDWSTTFPESWRAYSDKAGSVLLLRSKAVYVGTEVDHNDLFLQHIDATGHKQYADAGKLVNQTGPGGLLRFALLADGEIQLVWVGGTDGYGPLLGQRLDAAGNPLWEAGGREILPAMAKGYEAVDVTPSTGGTFFVGSWFFSGADFLPDGGDVRLVDAAGSAGPASSVGYGFDSASDGEGGVLLAWVVVDGQTADIVGQAQREDGTAAWLTNVCTDPATQEYPLIVPDGSGGALVTWIDHRNGSSDDFAQHLDASGAPLWATNGIPVVTGPGEQWVETIASDGAGGLIVPWFERNMNANDAYAKRLGPDGNTIWEVPLAVAPGAQRPTGGLLDGANGVVLTWDDTRYEPGKHLVFAQRLNLATGQWGADANAVAISSFNASATGVSVQLSATYRSDMHVRVVNIYRGESSGPLAQIATLDDMAPGTFRFIDTRVRPNTTYRYQLGVVDAEGEFLTPVATVAVPALALSLEQNQPNPFNPSTTIRFVIPAAGPAVLKIYSADGRMVRTIFDAMAPAGSAEVNWDGRDAAGMPVSSGIYFYRLQAGKQSATRKMMLLK